MSDDLISRKALLEEIDLNFIQCVVKPLALAVGSVK